MYLFILSLKIIMSGAIWLYILFNFLLFLEVPCSLVMIFVFIALSEMQCFFFQVGRVTVTQKILKLFFIYSEFNPKNRLSLDRNGTTCFPS